MQPQPVIIKQPHENLIGTTINGRYRLDALIGVGGMGAVYRAMRLMINDKVAVKVMHLQHQTDAGSIERFQREIQAGARLKHPNTVGIYDFGVAENGMLYIAMELIEGQNLRQIISAQGPLAVTATVNIIAQVCAALDEAHRQAVIHRDLKPDNIIVAPMAGGLQVKILDFGVAKLRDQAPSNLTQTGNVMGTPYYMSPEQCKGEELDHRSDIYSLGVVIFEMLCGRVPFDAQASTAVVLNHVNQSPPPLRSINPSISAEVEAVVMRALEKHREHRQQTAGELANQLIAAMNGVFPPPLYPTSNAFSQTVVLPPQPQFPSQANPVAQQPVHPSGNTTTVLSGSSHIAGVPSSGAQYTNAPYQYAVPQAASQKQSKTLLAVLAVLLFVAGGVIIFLVYDSSRQKSSSTASSNVAPSSTSPTPRGASLNALPNAPRGAIRRATCLYRGARIREYPNQDSKILIAIDNGQGLWVFSESENRDVIFFNSKGREVEDNWTEVEMVDNPAVHGWIWSGFLKP